MIQNGEHNRITSTIQQIQEVKVITKNGEYLLFEIILHVAMITKMSGRDSGTINDDSLVVL